MKLVSAKLYVILKERIEFARKQTSIPFSSLEFVDFVIDDERLPPESGRLGMYDPRYENLVFVSSMVEDSPEFLVSTIVHELRHMYQHQKWGFLYHVLAAIVLRQLTIEPSAIALENEVDKIIGMEGLRDGDKGSRRLK